LGIPYDSQQVPQKGNSIRNSRRGLWSEGIIVSNL
jgi:hypothetical protein